MNKLPSAKRVALLTTPTIALVLFGIQQMLQSVPTEILCPAPTEILCPAPTEILCPAPTEILCPAPETPPAIAIAKAQRHVAMTDKQLPVADGFKHVDRIVWNHMLAGYHCPDNIDSSINDLGVVFPKNMPIQEVDANLRAIARELFEDGTKYVTISAFSGDPKGDALYPDEVAHLIFAPYGDLRKTDRLYNRDEYKAVITHKSSFQQPKQKVPVRVRFASGWLVRKEAEERNEH